MKNIICIIDDHATLTAPVVRGLMLYEQRKCADLPEVFYKLVFAIGESDNNESVKQLKEKLKKEFNKKAKVSKLLYKDIPIKKNYEIYLQSPDLFIEKIKSKMGITPVDKTIFLLDLELFEKKDQEKLRHNEACLSMELYRKFLENQEKCILFSTYGEEGFIDSWCKQYKKSGGIDKPPIVSREYLFANSFNLEIGEEIFNGLR